MERRSSHYPLHFLQTYGKFFVLGALVVGGLALKPTSMLNARSPQVMADGSQKQLQATDAARVKQRQEQTRQVRPENYDVSRFPVTNQNEKHWRNILWTTAVVEPQEAFVAEALDQILGMMTQRGLSDAQMRTVDAAAKVGTQLHLRYPQIYGRLSQRFLRAIEASPDPEWTAVSLSVLAKSGLPLTQVQTLAERVKQRFPAWTNNVYLYTTIREVAEMLAPSPTPPLAELLKWTIAPNQLHLYVVCNPNRDRLCYTVLKDRDGEFVRYGDGQLWSVPLLLRSIHGLRWNFVRGETPTGIYRIEGVVPQPDDAFFRAYGQFSLVNLYVPFESGAKQFVPGKAGRFQGTIRDYQILLPPSWRNYWNIQQSYWAGKVGRSAFRIHGTGEAPDFFSNKGNVLETYNWNPTIGCLSALELYNERGQLLQADMPKILKALEMAGGKNFAGYMTVVEVTGQDGQPVTVDDIDALLRQNTASVKTKSKYVRSTKPGARSKAAAVQAPKAETAPEPLDEKQTEATTIAVPVSALQPEIMPESAGTVSSPEPEPSPTGDTSTSPAVQPLPVGY